MTTLEADHLDIYGTLEGVEDAFLAFLDPVPSDGLIVGCADDSGVGRLLARVPEGTAPVVTYGLGAGAMLRAESVRAEGTETAFTVRERGELLGEARLRVPGLHNVRNALAAVAVARHLGAGWESIAEGLGGYTGVARRFESVGEAGGVRVVDDYAHHPTEVDATLRAARSAFPGRRLVAVFQPHLFSRTRDFAADFGRALAQADELFLASIYPAREQPIPGVTSELIVEHARAAGARVHLVADRADVPARVAEALRPGDVCLTLGAGDLDQAARDILALLSRAAG